MEYIFHKNYNMTKINNHSNNEKNNDQNKKLNFSSLQLIIIFLYFIVFVLFLYKIKLKKKTLIKENRNLKR